MKNLVIIFLVGFVTLSVNGQNRFNFNQYMLNQNTFNPGYLDAYTRFGGTVIARKQWMTTASSPLSFQGNGYYQFTKNHGVSGLINQDNIENFNTIEVSTGYTYHAWLGKKVALGLGLRIGFEQRGQKNNFVYFNELEPTLNKTSSAAFQMGTGFSLQSQNFDFGFSLPHIFNNTYPNKSMTYKTDYNTFYGHFGYKLRFNDNFILYPSALIKGVKGSLPSMSFDGHFLVNQMAWFGGGYRSDNTVSLSAGILLDKGLRLIYTYESAIFSPHTRIDVTHEITVNYARSIADNPFAKRRYTKRKGGSFKRKLR
jgi:type IX secretion system PorP/SprF family membrane protein